MHTKLLSFMFLIATTLLTSPVTWAMPSQQVSHRAHSVPSMVDVNHASVQQLQSIKGIGPKRAAAIIAYREEHHGFSQIDEFLRIKGIGKKLFNKIKKSIRVT